MTVRQALPYLRNPASVILMGSDYATMEPPGAAAYAASKAAMAGSLRYVRGEPV